MSDISAVFENVRDVIVIKVQDQEITHDTGESIHSQMPPDSAAGKPPKIVVDLSNLTFLGSIGLTVLVVLLKRVKTAGGHLVVSGLTGQCRNVMTVTRLDKAFEFYDNADQAAAALQDN